MKTVTKTIAAALILIASMTVASCEDYNYTDKLQNLGRRVEYLEETLSNYMADLSGLQKVVNTVKSQGYITQFTNNHDGSYTLTFNTNETITIREGKQGRDGRDGRDGRELDFLISVAKDADGVWYWTLNGEWILDGDGNKLSASPTDGKDGQDGKDGRDGIDGRDGQNNPDNPAIIPQIRINEVTRNWEISTDSGETWEDTGVCADGKDGKDGKDGADGKDGKDGKDGADGKDGKDGADGPDDIFDGITESEDGKSITISLTDGQTFTIPIIE